jgi:hypothetical protein
MKLCGNRHSFPSNDNGTVSWKSNRLKVTDEMRVRLGAVAERFQSKSYFGAERPKTNRSPRRPGFRSSLKRSKGGSSWNCGKSQSADRNRKSII